MLVDIDNIGLGTGAFKIDIRRRRWDDQDLKYSGSDRVCLCRIGGTGDSCCNGGRRRDSYDIYIVVWRISMCSSEYDGVLDINVDVDTRGPR